MARIPLTGDLVLGISMSHDAGVALAQDGRILAALNEERLNRRKQTSGLPELALAEIWNVVSARPEDIGLVAVANRHQLGVPPTNNDFTNDAGNYPLRLRMAEQIFKVPGVARFARSEAGSRVYRTYGELAANRNPHGLRELILGLGVNAPVLFFDHHDCHVASGCWASGFDECLVLSNDGFGDGLSAKVAVFRNGRLRTVVSNSFVNSLGVYYNCVTHFCGFLKSHHAGKTTGLAAYGNPGETMDFFRRSVPWVEKAGRYINRGPIFRQILDLIECTFAKTPREDVAAGIQKHTEEVLQAMARHYTLRFGIHNVVLTGGVHANVKANQAIGCLDEVKEVYVFPNMGDGGLAAGAAYRGSPSTLGLPGDSRKLELVYLGSAFSESQIRSSLDRADLPNKRLANPDEALAECIASGEVVARFDGRMEYGPRALGNRSILYQATDPRVNTWLNRQLGRTEFMPFAPVVREEDTARFFELPASVLRSAEFMTVTCCVTERCRNEAPAVVHVDGTARPQVLRRATNPGFYRLIDCYHRLTGLSILVNTSFNLHEEPIVCTPDEAIDAFRQSRLDRLMIGPYLVSNPDVRRR